MYDTELLLKKAAQGSKNTPPSLATLQPLSLAEIRRKFENVLSWSEAKHLYREAQEQLKKNKILESRIFTRANPQLPQAIRSGIRENATPHGYESMFGSRSSSFVKPGSVASMFSPAGYLTELYREAKGLHLENSSYNLDVRRPDLAGLLLNQENMDEEISTLTLSNDIMLSHVEKQSGISGDELLEKFATDRFSAATPYHQPYEVLRQSILTLDPELDALIAAPDVLSKADNASLLSMLTNISPELHDILVEEITDDNAPALFRKNFPENISPEYFTSKRNIINYYNLDDDELHILNNFVPDVENLTRGNRTYDANGVCSGISLGDNPEYYRISRVSNNSDGICELLYDGEGNFSWRTWVNGNYTADLTVQANKSTDIGVIESPYHHVWNEIELGSLSTFIKDKKINIRNQHSVATWTIYGDADFFIEVLNFSSYALKINKAIRLCRATGITPEQLESVVYSADTDGIINESVLTLLFNALYLRQKYDTDLDKALVLAGANISRFIGSAGVSHFDRLFNTPALAGEWFSSDGSVINPAPDATDDIFARDSLLRGLNITRGELYQLVLMAGLHDDKEELELTIENVSILYRLSLVAHLNDLTVNELYLLFTVSPLTVANSTAFVQYFYLLSRWMKSVDLTAAEVWMMTTDTFDTRLTPEMQTLRSNIQAQGVDTATSDEECRRQVAPFISGALGLTSPDMAGSLVLWCENSGCFTLDNFLTLLLQEALSVEDEGTLARYLHVLAQYSLTAQVLSLSEAEVSALAGILGARVLLPEDDLANGALARLMSLHYFHQWLNTLGRESSTVLAALKEGKLTTALMASAMGMDEVVLSQALVCVDEEASIETTLGNWQIIYQILQWVNVATALNTMPRVVKQLVDIRLSGTTAEQPSWKEWKALSRSLEAALTQRQAATLAANAADRLSDVLCSWFLGNVDVDGVALTSRDDLYSYFLIDNQVSSEVKTTRLAEAISGIQLYINRALNRIEPNAVAGVSTRQFFIDWEMNSRYSTWGGVSRLAYYPENYVDPLQRLGQTNMMDELLQNINQSQLNEDTVEDAFKTYLARFETVANLKVISGYHDNVNSDAGKTWFIGRGQEVGGEYYWRNADMSRLNEGKLVANAWSEWVKIDAPINAWNDIVRPVIFRDRLYVSWVEREEIATNDTNGTNNPVISYRYTLKLAFLRHDDNWSSPWSYDVTDKITFLSGGIPDWSTDKLGLCASCYHGENTLVILLYGVKSNEQEYDFGEHTKEVSGLTIYADGSHKNITGLSQFDALKDTLTVEHATRGRINKVNYRFARDFDVPTSLVLGDSIGDYNLTKMEAKRLGITSRYNSGHLFIGLQASSFTLRYLDDNKLLSNYRSRQVKTMKACGVAGDSFILAREVALYAMQNTSTQYGPVTVYNETQNKIGWGLYSNKEQSPSSGHFIYLYAQPTSSAVYELGTTGQYYGVSDQSVTLAKYRTVNYVGFGKSSSNPLNTYKYNGELDINTAVNHAQATVSVKTNNSNTKVFPASTHGINNPEASFAPITYTFNLPEIDVSDLVYTQNRANLNITYEAKSADGRSLGKCTNNLVINKVDYSPDNQFFIFETAAGVQYLQSDVYRIRLNTLLASQLVSQAQTGINAVLSMETQQFLEPQLGRGGFIQITLPRYNPTVHGENANVAIMVGDYGGMSAIGRKVMWRGMLTDIEQSVVVFIPTSRKSYGDPLDYPLENVERMKVSMSHSKSTATEVGNLYYDEDNLNLTSFVRVSSLSSDYPYITVLGKHTTTPLDFNSACALYYWELFYYVPMMCFRRFLDEKKFSEARHWLNYIWNPNGYIVNGEIAQWIWNCRPLEETTSWNANPLDAIDPDAVAQNDPTHYKVATFMSFIELLITRGDMCYRELTRDALAEAKMWYLYALEVMGDEPDDNGTASWHSPTLGTAASETERAEYQEVLTRLEAGEVDEPGDTRTANSLTGLFLPEYNPALTECWASLRLRLYNLRHNLSIDGQPLNLPIYADPVDPAALLSSMVQASAGGAVLPQGTLSLYRFPVMLERARNLVGQLTQFGSTLLNVAEHQDAEELNGLMLHQGLELAAQSLLIQKNMITELVADRDSLEASRRGAQERLDKYSALYDDNISAAEQGEMNMLNVAAGFATAAQPLLIVGGTLNALPNIYGFACGGAKYGAPSQAVGAGLQLIASSLELQSNKISRSEMYRRRREEWEIQRSSAQHEVEQIDAQLEGIAVRLESARLQVEHQEMQQKHTLAQLEFMQRKFTNQALYSWMRGKLSAIYYQFFDIAQSCCLMAQEALRRELNDNSLTFIRGSAWNGSTAGFMAGETLLLNLAEMDKAWMERNVRALEVTRTVSLAQVYAGLTSDSFSLTEAVANNTQTSGNKTWGADGNEVKQDGDKELTASLKLSGLNIKGDYKASLGATRRLKQVSVTLPALVGPYEDVRAVLSYDGSVVMPRGCSAIAVSHGMNDSGQFQLDFNDARYLPFEGIPVDDAGSLTLSFPDATGRQKALLESLNDIILHIRYTIQS